MKNRILAALLLAVMLLGLFTACGSSDQNEGVDQLGDTANSPYLVGDASVTSDKMQYEKFQALKDDALNRAGEVTEENAEAIYTDSNNITWLYKDDIIVIRGTGTLATPWYKIEPWEGLSGEFRKAVKTIVVDEGITELGNIAISDFGENGTVDAIVLPESLNNIQESGLRNSVVALFFPSKEVEIAERGILCSNGPEYIDIGKSRLNDIYMGDLQTITMSIDHPYYVMEKNAVYTNDMSTLVRLTDMTASEFKIPNTVTTIGETAFAGSMLETIIIPDNVKRIERNAFAWSNRLDSVTLSDSVEWVGDNAFLNCSISEIYMGKAIWEDPGHIGSQSPLVAIKISVHPEHPEYQVYTGSLYDTEYVGLLCDKDNNPLIDGLYWYLYEKTNN